MKRVNEAVTARYEAKVLDYFVAKIPTWVTPDLLTSFAFLSGLFGFLLYISAADNINLLWGANVALFFHWFADGLDGRLARFRRAPRPNYGYYIDHLLDSVTVVFFLGGLFLSGLTHTSAWMWAMVLMLISMIHSFLKTKILGTFVPSLRNVGPTEGRILLVLMNFVILAFGNPLVWFSNRAVPLLDIFGWVAVTLLLIVGVPEVVRTISLLNSMDQKNLK